MRRINRPIVLDIIKVLFTMLFVYAATMKLVDHDLFEAQIGKSPLIIYHAWWLSWVVPIVEIVISMALFVPRIELIALYAFFFMMFLFTGYIAFLLTFSPYVPCSCGGVLSSMGWTEHLIFNIGFTLLSVLGIVLYNKRKIKEQELVTSLN
jgi:uncharacterized membrane protein YphA (DoxX/SURF4 family)